MAKLKTLKVLVWIPLFASFYTKAMCQNPIADTTLFRTDLTKFNLTSNGSQNIDFNFLDQKKLIEIGLWNDRILSKILVPVDSLVAEQFNFSSSGLLSSKRQMKLISGKYVEDGRASFYDETGTLSHFYTYRSGVIDGAFISYYKSGMVECIGSYKSGSQYGVWNYYNMNGVLIKKKKW